MENPECRKKVEEMAASFRNLSEEINALKLCIETIVIMRSAICHYPACAPLLESFKGSEALAWQRLAALEVAVKELGEESKKLNEFMDSLPEGGVQ